MLEITFEEVRKSLRAYLLDETNALASLLVHYAVLTMTKWIFMGSLRVEPYSVITYEIGEG